MRVEYSESMPKTHKLYCFVDETGQDTLGELFIVAVVVSDERQQELENSLEHLEQDSGKHRRKWLKSRDRERQAYISTLTDQKLPATIFVKNYRDKTAFDELEVLTTAQALNVYREECGIAGDGYKVTITIDSLSKTMAVRMGSEFRKLGIKTRKVIGKKDEASAIIRLADAIAGLVREAHEGRAEYKKLEAKLKKNKLLYEL